MKTFRVPLIEKILHIYSGKDEWEQFKRASIKAGAYQESLDAPCPGEGTGRSFGSWIWVQCLSDRETLIHELSHFLDDMMLNLSSSDSEFRAYCTAWVIDTVLTWARGLK